MREPPGIQACWAQEIVYMTKYDDVLRTGLRASKTPEDIFDTGKLQEDLSKIEREFDKEKSPNGPTDGTTDGTAGEAATASQTQDQQPEATGARESENVAKFLEFVDKKSPMTEEKMDCIRAAEIQARRLIDAHVSLVVFPKSEKQARAIFKGSIANKVQGVLGKKYVGIIIDPGQMGETVTAPHVRIPPLASDELRMFMRALITERAPPDGNTLAAHDLYFVFDNGHPVNMQKCTQIFVNSENEPIQKNSFRIYLSFDEDSQRARKSIVRAMTFDQIEDMRIFSAQPFHDMGLPVLKRLSFPGTNMGNKIGDITLPAYTMVWNEQCRVKHDIHGAKRQAVGAKVEAQEDIGRGQKRKTLETVEPVSSCNNQASLASQSCGSKL